MHFRHLVRHFGEKYAIGAIKHADLQLYIDARLKQKHNGRFIGSTTTKKEITTLRAMWNFAAIRGMVTGMFPSLGLRYPKTDAKLPFMTLAEVEKKLAIGGLTDIEKEKLFESLFLRREEINELLEFVKTQDVYKWIYPLIATAALTGTRTSELVRIEVTDVDFEREILLIREKKRSKKQRTTRHVSLTSRLKAILTEWISNHPGGRYLFCHSEIIPKSKKRSATTKDKELAKLPDISRRKAMVQRDPAGIAQLTKDEVYDHFKRTLANSRWKVIRGLHTLRHSFISCLAAAGIDQRIIDEFVGHSTEEQRQRYRHLLPDVKQKAISEAFG